jgi:hypothetical protein
LFEKTGMNRAGKVVMGNLQATTPASKKRAERCAKFTDAIQDLAITYDQIPSAPGFLQVL